MGGFPEPFLGDARPDLRKPGAAVTDNTAGASRTDKFRSGGTCVWARRRTIPGERSGEWRTRDTHVLHQWRAACGLLRIQRPGGCDRAATFPESKLAR